MKTVTYHCDYCNDLIPENGEMIKLQSDSGINISNTFAAHKSCKLNNWAEFHFCNPKCMTNKFLGIPQNTKTVAPPVPAITPMSSFPYPRFTAFPKVENVNPDDTAEKYYNNLEKSAIEKPSEEFTSYLFFIDKKYNVINAVKKSDFKSYNKGIRLQKNYTLINGKLLKPDPLSLSKNYLISKNNEYATINEVAELISLMEKNEPGLKVHFANPNL